MKPNTPKTDKQDANNAASSEYKVIAVSTEPKRSTALSRKIPARDQKHHNLTSQLRKSNIQDASVEARISSANLGMDAITQTDHAKESADDESSSKRTYCEKLESLAKELSEIRYLLERVRSS
jgi:hypothetical protein